MARKIVNTVELTHTPEEIEASIQRYLLALDAYDQTKRIREEYDTAIQELINVVGLGFYFNDPAFGTVFKTLVPKGRFVEFKHVDVAYTKRDHLGEKQGILSMKEAQDQGFSLQAEKV